MLRDFTLIKKKKLCESNLTKDSSKQTLLVRVCVLSPSVVSDSLQTYGL